MFKYFNRMTIIEESGEVSRVPHDIRFAPDDMTKYEQNRAMEEECDSFPNSGKLIRELTLIVS